MCAEAPSSTPLTRRVPAWAATIFDVRPRSFSNPYSVLSVSFQPRSDIQVPKLDAHACMYDMKSNHLSGCGKKLSGPAALKPSNPGTSTRYGASPPEPALVSSPNPSICPSWSGGQSSPACEPVAPQAELACLRPKPWNNSCATDCSGLFPATTENDSCSVFR